MSANVRLLLGLASFVVAFSGKRLATCRDPRVAGPREPVNSRHPVQPRDPPPKGQPAGDLIGRVRTDVDDVVGGDQPHAGIEVGLIEFRESLGEPFGLPGYEFECSVSIPTTDSRHPFATERAFAVVHEGRFCLWYACHVIVQYLATRQVRALRLGPRMTV